jgi:hypothetical protein
MVSHSILTSSGIQQKKNLNQKDIDKTIKTLTKEAIERKQYARPKSAFEGNQTSTTRKKLNIPKIKQGSGNLKDLDEFL